MINYGLLSYNYDFRGEMNIGDYIQSVAAQQFLPQTDDFINREHLNDYKGGPIKLIMNGWFTHEFSNWPPSRNIQPLFVSFHITPRAAESMLNDEGVEYLKQHEPIGCRDFHTLNMLQLKGITAYYSSCLTLTLNKPSISDLIKDVDKKIYIVDVFTGYPVLKELFAGGVFDFIKKMNRQTIKKLLRKHFFSFSILSKKMRNKVVYKSHYLNDILTPEEWVEKTKALLKEYSNAHLVVTSRIHCALPCIAMGIPVIFVNEGIKHGEKERINDMLPFFNEISWDGSGKMIKKFAFNSNRKIKFTDKLKNFETHIPFRDNLSKMVTNFINK